LALRAGDDGWKRVGSEVAINKGDNRAEIDWLSLDSKEMIWRSISGQDPHSCMLPFSWDEEKH
jgi:hypothetical protein